MWNRRHVLKNQFYFLNVEDEMLRMNRRCRLAGVDLIFDLCFMYRLQTGTTPGILVIINFLTGQFISFRVFSSLNQMYILENKFQDFNFLPSIDDVCGKTSWKRRTDLTSC